MRLVKVLIPLSLSAFLGLGWQHYADLSSSASARLTYSKYTLGVFGTAKPVIYGETVIISKGRNLH